MHPAYSVIFFTAATGAGYGMLLIFGVAGAFGPLSLDRGFAVAGAGLAYLLIIGGLLSSTFHLGHPERSWRALTQWQSSWLSREGVMAIVSFAPTGVFAFGWVFLGKTDGVFAIAGLLGAAACVLTVYTTSMIYASLRTVHAWSVPWVTPAYLIMSLASGALLANALAHAFDVAMKLDHVVIATVIGVAIVKAAYWHSIDGQSGDSTPGSATGLGQLGSIRLLDPPHTGTNFLMTEMGYRVARKHALKLRHIAVAAGIAAPLGLTCVAMVSTGQLAVTGAILAALSAAVGVLIERWLFFAEARHVVTLYYGASNA